MCSSRMGKGDGMRSQRTGRAADGGGTHRCVHGCGRPRRQPGGHADLSHGGWARESGRRREQRRWDSPALFKGSPPGSSPRSHVEPDRPAVHGPAGQRRDAGTARRGVFINIGSVNGMRPALGVAAYGAARAALLNLTQSLAGEFAPKFRVNSVTTGIIGTPEIFEQHYDNDQRRIAAMHADIPLGRMSTPEDVSDPACSSRCHSPPKSLAPTSSSTAAGSRAAPFRHSPTRRSWWLDGLHPRLRAACDCRSVAARRRDCCRHRHIGLGDRVVPADVIDADSAEIALAEAARRFGTPCHVIIDAADLPSGDPTPDQVLASVLTGRSHS